VERGVGKVERITINYSKIGRKKKAERQKGEIPIGLPIGGVPFPEETNQKKRVCPIGEK